MDESTAALLTNGIDLEGQIKAEFVKAASLRELRPANSAALTARVPSVAMPEYVQHRKEATEIGKLSAEAIVGEYEAAAKERRPDGIFVAPFEAGEIGPDLFRAACEFGLEGLVSKRR